MTTVDSLGGHLLLRPGRPRPHNLVSSRVDWAAVLAQGRPVADLPHLLGCLYTMCGQAHRLCASMASEAAQGRTGPQRGAVPPLLVRETLREHLRRIGLDWPAVLPAAADGDPVPDWARCPAFGDDDALASLRWIERTLLGLPAAHWLARWQHGPAAWLARWGRGASTPAARWFERCRSVPCQVPPHTAALQVHADDHGLRALAESLFADAGFSRRPTWRGACAETGPSARLLGSPSPMDTPWLRLGARLAELVALALDRSLPDTAAPRLMCGSLPTGPGEGLAWVEMARGLLVHAVRVEGVGSQARVAACRVLAPTEWNFHPQAAVAHYLEGMGSAPTPARVRGLRLLVAAYDPCVRFEVELDAECEPEQQQMGQDNA